MLEGQIPKPKTPSTNGSNVRLVLQERDLRLLRTLSILRIIDRQQAALIAPFTSTTRANSRLHKLNQAGLLKRFFFVSALGGKRAVYSLSKKGAEVCGVVTHPINRPADSFLIGDKFTAHQLAINDVYCAATSKNPEGKPNIQNWQSFSKPVSLTSAIIPDAYFEIRTIEDIRPAFLEVDLGTEAFPVWDRKVKGYLSLATSGEFEKQFGHSRFRVLVVLPSEARLHSLRAHISKTTSKLFYFSTFQKISTEGFWANIWLRPEGQQTQSLS